jgi:hypothetical protein
VADSERMNTEQLLEEIRKLKVTDVLLSTMSTIAQLAYAKLEESSRDLPQAKVAVESLRALLPVLEGNVEEGALRDYRQVVANLQLAYAEAAAG